MWITQTFDGIRINSDVYQIRKEKYGWNHVKFNTCLNFLWFPSSIFESFQTRNLSSKKYLCKYMDFKKKKKKERKLANIIF